ncbi:DoxX family protein [Aquiflexum lacus]|uniref:DoxX family protein n=1 Tax=Aquiflexum lacus TaxID=2483805 RepID=UPI00189463D7|nr:DoxX family protein [Aquiflexum lacus]
MTTKTIVSLRSIHVLRIMLSGIFLVAGVNHLMNVAQTANRITQANNNGMALLFGNPELMVILSGITMLLAGIAFIIGFKTRWAAVILLAVLIPITLTIQVGQANTLGPLFKNIAIMGGLLFFILNDFTKEKNTKTNALKPN